MGNMCSTVETKTSHHRLEPLTTKHIHSTSVAYKQLASLRLILQRDHSNAILCSLAKQDSSAAFGVRLLSKEETLYFNSTYSGVRSRIETIQLRLNALNSVHPLTLNDHQPTAWTIVRSELEILQGGSEDGKIHEINDLLAEFKAFIDKFKSKTSEKVATLPEPRAPPRSQSAMVYEGSDIFIVLSSTSLRTEGQLYPLTPLAA